jgi:hypothetical protein
MSHLTLSQPLRPAGPSTVEIPSGGRGGAHRISSPVQRELASPRITLHFQSRASILTLSPAAQQTARSHRADGKTIVHPVVRLAITFVLAILTMASAAVVAFGTDPRLAQYPSGMDWITLSRRLQWPLTTLCLALCIGLIALVVSGKRRAGWLLILGPVLFLFYTRFAGDPFRRMAILDNPSFVNFDKASFLKPESPVIGLVFEGQPYAYPTGCLALAPVIAHADADKRLLVMYSPYAGRAQAFVVDNTVKPRELDIVSMPANAMLLYNSRIGQFINAFTGTTLKGERPDGFKTPIETKKMTWREWRTQYPDTQVLATALSPAAEKVVARFPNRPVQLDLPADTRVEVLSSIAHPVALQIGRFGGMGEPLNLTTAGGAHLLVVRTKSGGKPTIFERTIQGDLFPQFKRKTISNKPDVAFVDSDTASLWNIDGRCLDGPAKGEQLKAVRVEEDVPYGTLKSFYPNLELLKP